MNPRIAEVLRLGRGVIARSTDPGLAGAIDAARKQGDLVSVLPGVYAAPADAGRLVIRARAAHTRDPGAVFVGRTAAWLLGWDELGPPEEIALATVCLRSRSGIRCERKTIPPCWIRPVDGLPATSPAATAVDLIPECGPDVVDLALRRGVALGELKQIVELLPHRAGNALRREVLRDSRDLPWSAAERCAHRALRDRRITGWTANLPIRRSPSAPVIAYADIGFQRLRLALEIDGRQWHDNDRAFESDRACDERLALLGWQVVRFAARRVFADPTGFAKATAALVATRSRQLGRRG